LDVQDVDMVINYELPESAEWFTHRVGRTGRMGRSGQAITFLTADDAAKWREIERALGRKLRRQAWGETRVVSPSLTAARAAAPAPRAARADAAATAPPRNPRRKVWDRRPRRSGVPARAGARSRFAAA
jgi:superfamily II DNA/RNA helicase